jgi:signal transduction histidine kinase
MASALLIAGLTLGAGALGWWLAQRRHAVQPLPQHSDALEQAVSAERERIFADLHDDLGAKLLQLVYESSNPQQADLARSALQDLRDVVSRTRGCSGSLLEVLGEMEIEARQRLRAAQIELHWEQPEHIVDSPLDRAQSLHLFRIVREAISNVIRHAAASHLQVRVHWQPRGLNLEIVDDGTGLDQPTAAQGADQPGRGTANMRVRAQELEGRITWRGATAGGTRVILSLPLRGDP